VSAFLSPYNFVPLADWVYCPDWAGQVSHDVPFSDGLSGEIHYTLIAETPLLVGGRQVPARANAPGEVRAYRMPDGTPAVPGASLQGMLRAVTEIATFSRMRQVDDLRFALRDLSGTRVQALYSKPMKQAQAGFLRRCPDGSIVIEPCSFAYVAHADLHLLGVRAEHFSKRGETVASKEAEADRAGALQLRFTPPTGTAGNLSESTARRATNLGKGNVVGRLVVTTQISQWDQKNGKGKKFDFVFYDRRPDAILPVDAEAWRHFLWIHDGEEADRPWPGYWKAKFFDGEDVPVFFLPADGRVPLRFGLARMFRLAGRYGVRDAIAAASDQHLDDDAADLSDLLFGRLGGDLRGGGQQVAPGLKGRAAFPPAVAIDPETDETELGPTVLSSPKPSFFPAYLEQGERETIPKGQTYMTWDGDGQEKKGNRARIRGWKRYLLRPDVAVPPPPENSTPQVQVKLFPLVKGARFRGRVVFHNLRPVELGALLWAMTLGGTEGARHSLGMGKPFGLGQVRFELDEGNSQILPNRLQAPADSFADLISSFQSHMEQVCAARRGWRNSPQVASLLGMAKVAGNAAALGYPGLNEFQKIKNEGKVLPRPSMAKGAVGLRSEDEVVEGCKLKFHPGSKELVFTVQGKPAIWRGPEAEGWVAGLGERLKARLRKEKLTARVRIERIGNQLKVVSAEAEEPPT
jgi:CRISPR-associated protein (TIGR03986 family)